MRKHARTRGVWGHASPEKFLKLGALRSLLRPYLYSNLYLDSMPLEYRAKYFWSVARHVQGSLSHHCMCSSDGVWSKGHRTRQFEGGAVKGKSIPRGGTCPWCPPPPPPVLPPILAPISVCQDCISLLRLAPTMFYIF